MIVLVVDDGGLMLESRGMFLYIKYQVPVTLALARNLKNCVPFEIFITVN